MARVTVELPSLLASAARGLRSIPLEASTLADALQRLGQLEPALFTRLVDESGEFRPHVLCFVNDRNTRWLNGKSVPLHDGDAIRFLQAVSGG
jgi:molybdopterin converting factor small subunit